MKAVYPSLSYTLFILISVVVLSIILVSINSFIDDLQEIYAYAQVNYVAENIKNEIFKLYSGGAEGRFELFIPEKILEKKYFIEFDGNNIKIKLDIKGKTIESENLINVTVDLSGRSYAPASIEMNKTNGDVSIKLV